MSVDFGDAAQRHWTDAELFNGQQRWSNADHLYGFAAECSLKAVMVALGMQLRPDGRPVDPHGVHINKLWPQFPSFATGRAQAGYAAMLQQVNPFSNWDVHQRYWGSGQISQPEASAHRQGALQALKVLAQARQDGRVK